MKYASAAHTFWSADVRWVAVRVWINHHIQAIILNALRTATVKVQVPTDSTEVRMK